MEIYLSNLQTDVSLEDIRQTFSFVGQVSSVRYEQGTEEDSKEYIVITLMPNEITRELSLTEAPSFTSFL